VVEGARLESVYRGNSIQGSNPCLSANEIDRLTGAGDAVHDSSVEFKRSPVGVATITDSVDCDGVLRLVKDHAVATDAQPEQPSNSPLSGFMEPEPVAA
jgi:hypothetical protein